MLSRFKKIVCHFLRIVYSSLLALALVKIGCFCVWIAHGHVKKFVTTTCPNPLVLTAPPVDRSQSRGGNNNCLTGILQTLSQFSLLFRIRQQIYTYKQKPQRIQRIILVSRRRVGCHAWLKGIQNMTKLKSEWWLWLKKTFSNYSCFPMIVGLPETYRKQ